MKCGVRIYLNEEQAKKLNREKGWYVCSREAQGICRCTDVCKSHFAQLRADNKIRHEKGMDIPLDCNPLKVTKRFIRPLIKNENQEE